jgi:hypothetical protein
MHPLIGGDVGMEWLRHLSNSIDLRDVGIGAVVVTLLSGIASLWTLGVVYFAGRRAAQESERAAKLVSEQLRKIEQGIVKLDARERRGVFERITKLREEMLKKETDQRGNELNQTR